MESAENTKNPSTVILVTGANKGIGFEVAKALALKDPSSLVLMGCRDPEKGAEAALSLQQQELHVKHILLDVTDDASIREAVDFIAAQYGRLDVLINNAGIAVDALLQQPGASPRQVFQQQFDTNVFGVVQLTEALTPLLQKAQTPRLVFTSSWLASLAKRNDPEDRYHQTMDPAYRTSKAALNMLCSHYAAKFKDAGWKVNAVDPGHVATSLNRFRGPKPVETGATQLVRMALLGPDGPTGTFSNDEGAVPW